MLGWQRKSPLLRRHALVLVSVYVFVSFIIGTTFAHYSLPPLHNDHKSHHYFAFELADKHDYTKQQADEIAQTVVAEQFPFAEFVGHVGGALHGYYLLSIPKSAQRIRIELEIENKTIENDNNDYFNISSNNNSEDYVSLLKEVLESNDHDQVEEFIETFVQSLSPSYPFDSSSSTSSSSPSSLPKEKRDTTHVHMNSHNHILNPQHEPIKEHILHKRSIESHPKINWVEKQVPRKRLYKRQVSTPVQVRDEFRITDPLFTRQWHLVNHGMYAGNDLNVYGAWKKNVTGRGVTVCIVDDGIDMDHPDIADHFSREGSYDFNDKDPLPRPRLSDDYHGTRCAGEIAAIRNNVCGVGVAYDARVSGLRILSKEITEVDEAAAVNYGMATNDVYSCSWGPNDDGATLEGPGKMVREAFETAIREGRNKRGNIYVFATGNGGFKQDNCNYDGYTNSLYTISIGAIDRANNHPQYSEPCSAQLCVTYSSGQGEWIHTTDAYSGRCTSQHGGTSAAAPLAAGVFALVLSARPELTWRDVQHLIVKTSIPVNTDDNDWQINAVGRKVNHKFGYGKLDATKIVEAAMTHELVNPQTKFNSPLSEPNLAIIKDTGTCIQDKIIITKDMVNNATMKRLEHVTVTVNIQHGRRGGLGIGLKSPHGTKSMLGTPRLNDRDNKGFKEWTFMTVFHWDEDPVGEWTLRICDFSPLDYTGQLKHWYLTLWGESTQGTNTTIPPVPTPTPTSTVSPSPTPTSTTSTITNAPSTSPTLPTTTTSRNTTSEIETPTENLPTSPLKLLLIVLFAISGSVVAVGYVVTKYFSGARAYLSGFEKVSSEHLDATFDLDSTDDMVPLQDSPGSGSGGGGGNGSGNGNGRGGNVQVVVHSRSGSTQLLNDGGRGR